MATVYDYVAQFHQELLYADEKAMKRLARAYYFGLRDAYQANRALARKISEAKKAGLPVNPAWLMQQEQYRLLQDGLASRLAWWNTVSEAEVTKSMRWHIDQALKWGKKIIGAQIDPSLGAELAGQLGGRADEGAIVHAVGASQKGPLRKLLANRYGNMANDVAGVYVQGVMAGENPAVMARKVEGMLSQPLANTQTIMRTESMRAQREGTRMMLMQSPVVSGWRWLCALQTRTCAYCWSMHGTFHPVDEPMATHPNCRCTMVPQTKNPAELGIKEHQGVGNPTAYKVPDGQAEFDKLTGEQQAKILGDKRMSMYLANDNMKLADLRVQGISGEWGPWGRTASVKELAAKGFQVPVPENVTKLADTLGHTVSDQQAEQLLKLAKAAGKDPAVFVGEQMGLAMKQGLAKTGDDLGTILEKLGHGPSENTLNQLALQADHQAQLDKNLAKHLASAEHPPAPPPVGSTAVPVGEGWLPESAVREYVGLPEPPGSWHAQLSSAMQRAIRSYTGSHYSEMNAALRAGRLTDTVKALQNALHLAGEQLRGHTVWRGVAFRDGARAVGQATTTEGQVDALYQWALQKFPPGSIDGHAGQFLSTSMNPGFAAGWGGGLTSGKLVFEIKLKNGVNVRNMSSHPSEDEVIVPHGSQFRIVNVLRSVTLKNRHGDSYQRVVVQMEQIA